MKIRNKLFILLILIGMIPMITVSWVVLNIAEQSIIKSTKKHLHLVTESKKVQLENYFKEMELDILELSNRQAVRKIFSIFESYQKDENIKGTGKYPVQSKKWNNIVKDYSEFITEYIERYGYYDIFFINGYGQIIYTFKKESDLGENLSIGKIKDSGLALLWSRVLRERKFEIEDFKPYEPSGNLLACFVGVPVYDDDRKLLGVIGLQISMGKINSIVQHKEGLGETGETYLMGMNTDGKTSLRSSRVVKKGEIGDEKTDNVIEKVFIEKEQVHDLKIGSTGDEEFVCADIVNVGELEWGIFTTMSSDEVLEPVRKMKIYIFIGGFIGIIIIGVASFIFSNSLADPIRRLVSATKEISRGDLDNTISINRKDELGLLADSYREMQSDLLEKAKITDRIAEGDLDNVLVIRNKEDRLALSINKIVNNYKILNAKNEKQNWLKTGQNELNKRLRGEVNICQIASNTITFLAKYLKAQIGALYVYDENLEELILTGSYAFVKRKKLNERIKVGEGLVGQAAYERENISVTDLPEDYIRINSSLGEISPWNIIAIPFIYEKKLIGVAELGSIKEFSDESLEFLDVVKENIAVGLNSALSRNKMKNLLEKTQMQTEELQT